MQEEEEAAEAEEEDGKEDDEEEDDGKEDNKKEDNEEDDDEEDDDEEDDEESNSDEEDEKEEDLYCSINVIHIHGGYFLLYQVCTSCVPVFAVSICKLLIYIRFFHTVHRPRLCVLRMDIPWCLKVFPYFTHVSYSISS